MQHHSCLPLRAPPTDPALEGAWKGTASYWLKGIMPDSQISLRSSYYLPAPLFPACFYGPLLTLLPAEYSSPFLFSYAHHYQCKNTAFEEKYAWYNLCVWICNSTYHESKPLRQLFYLLVAEVILLLHLSLWNSGVDFQFSTPEQYTEFSNQRILYHKDLYIFICGTVPG